MKEIIFKIDAEGEVSMEVRGASGSSCDAFTAPFEEMLGTVASKDRKAEFYANENEEQHSSSEG